MYIVDGVSDPNWLKARCGNRVGLVPVNYSKKHLITMRTEVRKNLPIMIVIIFILVDENVEVMETPMHDAG